MGNTQEYIVRFKGDYSALAKDISKINAETKKLEDDEVLIKINYDGNIKDYNKKLGEISKKHPEIGVQFQYNANKKILDKEVEKLNQLTELELDIKENKVQDKLESLADNINSALIDQLSKEEISERVKTLFKYYNTAVEAGAKNIDFKSIKNRLIDDFSFESDEIADIWADIFDNNEIKPYKLFEIDKSLNEDISKTKIGISEIEAEMSRLEKLGAKKTQLPSEFEELQEKVKILNSNFNEMNERLKSLSGKEFINMKREVDDINDSLYITLNRLSEIEKYLKIPQKDDYVDRVIYRAVSSHNGNIRPFVSENSIYNGTFATDDIDVGKNYTEEKDYGYLYKATIRAKRSEIYEIIDPGSTWNKVLNLGKKEDAASREITSVYKDINDCYDELIDLVGDNEELKMKILNFKENRLKMGDDYSYDGTIDEDYLNYFLETGSGSVKSWLDEFESVINDKLKEAGVSEDKLDEITKRLKERVKRFFEISQDTSNMYGIHYTDVFGKIGAQLGYKLVDMYTNDSDKDAHSYFIADSGIIQGNPRLIGKHNTNSDNDSAQDAYIPIKINESQLNQIYDVDDLKEYISILDSAKVKEELFLQLLDKIKEYGGVGNLDESSVAKLSDIASANGYQFNSEELTDSAAEAAKKAADAIKKAQDSNSPADDFQQQLQNTINEAGEYVVKVYGELVEEFKSRLQTAIDETGIYHVDIEGWLVDGFHDRLQRDIDGDEKYVVEVKGKLVETFKEVLQEAIDGLGAFPIEVKPYMRKGGEIEEVDLPGNNGDNGTTEEIAETKSSPTQEFDNTLQKDLVYLENYKNTIEEINQLKLQPQTDETEKKIQELQKLADYFFGSISITQTEWGNDGGNFVDQYSLNYKSSLRTKGYGDAVDEIWNIGKNKDKLNVKALTSEFNGIDEEISRIESKSEELRQQFVKDLTESRNYVKELTSKFQEFVVWTNDVKTERSPSVIDVYNADIDLILKKFPVLEQFRDKFTSRQEAKEFVKTDEWMDFLATLPEAHKYLESIGYDFDKINEVSEEMATPESTDATTSALLSKKEVVEQLRAELKLTKKAAEELFDAQGFDKTNGKYQIEQQAVDKLIASLKEKKEVEETQDVTTPTSPVVNAMQSEAEVVDRVVENEKQKFDELKNKISKTIPKAIETKNKAFEKEGKLVAKIVDDEITYFEVLKDSVDEVTESVNKQQNIVKDSKPDNKKSKEKSKKKDDSTQPEEVNAGRLFYQVHKSEFDSLGKKSDVLKDMAKYYADLEKSSAKAYSDAEQKANGLINKIDKLRSSDKYTQDFVNELNNAKNELKIFLSQLENGTIPFDELDNKVTILANKIEKTLSQKAFGSVKLAAEKSLTNVGLKIDQLVAKNSAMGKEFETRFANLRSELDSAKTVEDVSRIIAEVNKLESELINAGKTGRSFIDQIKQRLRDINSKYIAQYFSFQDIIRYARQAAQSVIQLNDAFIELSKVSNTSLKALEADFQSYADIAENIGGTITDTISATADWARFNKIDPLYGNV